MLVFLSLAFRLSEKFAEITRRHSEQQLESSTLTGSFIYNFNTVIRLGLRDFFLEKFKSVTAISWNRFEEVRAFHSFRWFIQLSLFDLLSSGTLFYGAFQVINGTLPLGFLVLIRYAFGELQGFLIFVIEYYVNLVQQKQDSEIMRREFASLFQSEGAQKTEQITVKDWKTINLTNTKVVFTNAETGLPIKISAPNFKLNKGDKIGIIGESGAGKSTILMILLNLIEFDGSYNLDKINIKGKEFTKDSFSFISQHDPLFNISIRDNILLGKTTNLADLNIILDGVRAREFLGTLDQKVGDPAFNLSTGQAQRIRLARALVQNTEIYLLDEPFNGIDVENKEAIIDFLAKILKDKTVVLVTHNHSELRLVNEIYHFNDGVLTKSSQ